MLGDKTEAGIVARFGEGYGCISTTTPSSAHS